MRRFRQSVSEQECIRILEQQPRGVLAVHGEDGYPYAIPMDYIWLGGKLYFHSARTGHKIEAIAADRRVCFCVMDEGYRKDEEWALNIKSVVIFGKIRTVDDADEAKEIVRRLGLKYSPAPDYVEEEIKRAFGNVAILELSIDHMTGKLVNES